MINLPTSLREEAQALDRQDDLRAFREQFHIPPHRPGQDCLYFCGNSLGLQPKDAATFIGQEMKDWRDFAVKGHFDKPEPLMTYHRLLARDMADVVGAQPEEVVLMNTLTVNLHLMMVSFYRPTASRFKIIMEAGAFPSDQYAVASQVRFHGFDPEEAIIELAPRSGEHTLRTEDIRQRIEAEGDSLALVMMAGINYYTGQFYDLAAITQAAHRVGAVAGFDLAHAAGNVRLSLHDWQVDFAVWCTYKYLNSGPGGISGAFVHQRHATADLPRFAGWWGHNEARRFLMEKDYEPMPGAEGWQQSNAPILLLASLRPSLRLFAQAGMEALRAKSERLTAYLEGLIGALNATQDRVKITILTPKNPAERGCQLSLVFSQGGKAIFEAISAEGVVGDWREPDVIRVAPVPLYNTFEEVYRFGEILLRAITSLPE